MAKRRNAKKEKAARNKINARKFRKQTTRYGNRSRKNYSSDNQETADAKKSGNSSESSASNN